jgi:hypothetical protein
MDARTRSPPRHRPPGRRRAAKLLPALRHHRRVALGHLRTRVRPLTERFDQRGPHSPRPVPMSLRRLPGVLPIRAEAPRSYKLMFSLTGQPNHAWDGKLPGYPAFEVIQDAVAATRPEPRQPPPRPQACCGPRYTDSSYYETTVPRYPGPHSTAVRRGRARALRGDGSRRRASARAASRSSRHGASAGWRSWPEWTSSTRCSPPQSTWDAPGCSMRAPATGRRAAVRGRGLPLGIPGQLAPVAHRADPRRSPHGAGWCRGARCRGGVVEPREDGVLVGSSEPTRRRRP